jgi:hypothetical protein
MAPCSEHTFGMLYNTLFKMSKTFYKMSPEGVQVKLTYDNRGSAVYIHKVIHRKYSTT